jgi:hypothetical protein
MSDMTMHDGRSDGGAGGADVKATATMAIVLWVVVACALAYGLINTFRTALDLFGG